MMSSGSNVFAGTDSSVFKSTDNGVHWKSSSKNLPIGPQYISATSHIYSMVSNSAGIYVATYSDGIYFSSNSGSSWTAVNNGLNCQYPWYLAQTGSKIYVGSIDSGVYVTNNNGALWKQMNHGMKSNMIESVYSSGNVVIAGTGDAGLFTSSNSATDWVSGNVGLKNALVYDLEIQKDLMIAATDAGMFFSKNKGQSWVASNEGLTDRTIYDILIVDTTVIIATQYYGIYKRAINGKKWVHLNINISSSGYTRSIAFASGILYAQTQLKGVYISKDTGNNWELSNSGMYTTVFERLEVCGNRAFAATNGSGVYLASSDGKTWTKRSNGLPVSQAVYSIKQLGNKLYACIEWRGIYVSSDTGKNWSSLSSDPLTTNSYRLYIFDGKMLAFNPFGALILSNDSGKTWNNFKEGLTNKEVYCANSDSIDVYVGTSDGVWRMTLGEVYVNQYQIRAPEPFVIYPNPVSDILYVKTKFLPGEMFICDINGIKFEISNSILRGQGSDFIFSYNLRSMAAGVYCINAFIHGEWITQKFVHF